MVNYGQSGEGWTIVLRRQPAHAPRAGMMTDAG
jgi:hypothetical protein